MRSLRSSRRVTFLAAGAVVVAVGLGSGVWAYAASSTSGPTLITTRGAPTVVKSTGSTGSRLCLVPVPGVKAPKYTTEKPVPVKAKLVVVRSGCTTPAG